MEDEDALEENVEVGVTDTDTPEGPRIVPGLISGKSIKKWRSKTVTKGKRIYRGDDAHHRRHTILWGPNCLYSGMFCDYGATEGKFKDIL